MQSAHLAKVLVSAEDEASAGVVMEYVPGKSLATILGRAKEKSLLLPSELGVVLAHDAFAAMDFFHGFEGAGRVHGNVSLRTIMVGYSGDVRIVGYRLGQHSRVAVDVQVIKDLKPLASILFDLPFQMFPQELAQLVPRLLEDSISPEVAVDVTRRFLRSYKPPADARRKVASWLEQLFPGEREKETQEGERLLAEGIKLIAQARSENRGRVQNPVVGDEIGEYKILKVLGEGGMGRVYQAEHVTTAKHVALKILHPRVRTPAVEERFRREAESIHRIASPHVVDIEGFGLSADGKFLYLAMELLVGESLDRVLFKDKPLTPVRALKIGSQICQALTAAHRAGVIHRDLKPGNVMLVNRDGDADFVKVLDFGLARLDVGDATLTNVGDLIGTFAYMAPEQGQGKPATPKIDIYAVGELLYEMLTGRFPHEGGDEILVRKATLDAVPILQLRPDLPEATSKLVMKALARDPEERHATMAELGMGIDDIIGQTTMRSSVIRRPRFKAVAASALALLALVGGAAFLMTNQRGQAPSVTTSHETVPKIQPTYPSPSEDPTPTPPSTDVAVPVPAVPVVVAAPHPSPQADQPEKRSAKRRPDEPSADNLLLAAEKAFEVGSTIEAIQLGRQALEMGGGLAAHLALGKYYQSRRRYAEALEHYRAAVQMDPGNTRAAAGMEMVQKKLPSNQ
jgi:serine/threonine protein kinase